MQDPELDLTVTVERTGPGEALVRITGELDIRTSSPMLRPLGVLIGEPGFELMRLDLTGVGFCDHAGLRALHALGMAAGPGRVRIVAAHPSVDTILRLCGISTFLGYNAGAATCPG
ncbi:STAS domain-containing protein [Actinoplanes sp. NEAU-A12]|uniref:STAS domain-containing protein n=1 Tax=Actinoplanes sandaracinus TaxID=3045177 RepID=A0ABT6WC15_9ACTN|nr:STAS domain-containing protein [Actinoplanes sandaracinus]MDI6097287.1 STAS domain-containing protein [Actinoplanes sandaracinus]